MSDIATLLAETVESAPAPSTAPSAYARAARSPVAPAQGLRPWLRGLLVGGALLAVAGAGVFAQGLNTVSTSAGLLPLSWRAFYVASQSPGITPAQQQRLLEEARRRNPHVVRVRLALAANRLGADDIAGAIGEIAALRAMAPAMVDTMLSQLALVVRDQASAETVMDGINAHPELREPFLIAMVNARQPDAAQTQAFAQAAQRLPDSTLASGNTRMLAAELVARAGLYAQARSLALPDDTRAGLRLHAPSFADMTPRGAFGWQIGTGPWGAADPDPAGGLSLVAYGRNAGVLLQQLAALPAGRWRVALRYQPQGGDRLIALRMACADGAPLAETKLAGGRDEAVANLDINVPAQGCAGQRLSLAALSGGEGTSQTVRTIGFTVVELR
jgi:hypothetical protein